MQNLSNKKKLGFRIYSKLRDILIILYVSATLSGKGGLPFELGASCLLNGASSLLNGASCLLNVGRHVLGLFSLRRVILGGAVFGASCP